MLAEFLYQLFPYQIFKSVAFRGGMAYLTVFLVVNILMPKMIRLFRKEGITSDFTAVTKTGGPYQGATPIMGGLILIPAIALAVLLWAWINVYTLSLLWVMLCFFVIGALDDGAKVLHKRRIEKGLEEQNGYSDKADGISGTFRLFFEFLATFIALAGLHYITGGIDGHLNIPGVPIKNLHPELPYFLFIPFAALIIVGGANAVNLTDGLDSLASVPIVTTTFFIAAAAYIGGDIEWAAKLKIPFVSSDVKEVAIFAIALISACLTFLKFNSPPASIYMGDIGSLGLGATICAMYVLVKAELYLPIVGGVFVLAAVSAILQRLWFKFALWKKGRSWAEKNRLFYRAPYHHHQQVLITFKESEPDIQSVWHLLMTKLKLVQIHDEDKYLTPEQVNNKVIWSSHLRSILLLVIAMMIYFKVR